MSVSAAREAYLREYQSRWRRVKQEYRSQGGLLKLAGIFLPLSLLEDPRCKEWLTLQHVQFDLYGPAGYGSSLLLFQDHWLAREFLEQQRAAGKACQARRRERDAAVYQGESVGV